MMDVHMLLGKELDASYGTKKETPVPLLTEEQMKDTFDEDMEVSDSVTTSAFSTNEQLSYTLETMTPDSVQTGDRQIGRHAVW